MNRELQGNGDSGNTVVMRESRGFAGETCGNTAGMELSVEGYRGDGTCYQR